MQNLKIWKPYDYCQNQSIGLKLYNKHSNYNKIIELGKLV